MRDLYKALDLPISATRDEILAMISRCGSETLARDAKEVLLDDQKRTIYNKNFKILKEVAKIRQDLGILDGQAWKSTQAADFNPSPSRPIRSSGYKPRDYTPKTNLTAGIIVVIILYAIRFWPVTLFLIIGACNWLKDDEISSQEVETSPTTRPYDSLANKPNVYKNPDADLIELKLPETGGGYTYFGNEQLVGAFSVKTKQGENHYLIKLEDFYTKEKKAEFFIRGGDDFGIEVPRGTYRVKMASGRKWYGMKNLFGSRTSYSKANDSFPISNGDHWTVELIPQKYGNLRDTPIDAEDF